MARENHTDITFTYEPVYLNGRLRGDPDYIEFTVMSTNLGLGYSMLTRKDTPATDMAKDIAKKTTLRVQKVKEKWEQCKAYMLSQCTMENSLRVITSLVFESWTEETNTLMLRLDRYNDYEWIVQPHVSGDLVKPAMIKHFGTDICWKYSVPRPSI